MLGRVEGLEGGDEPYCAPYNACTRGSCISTRTGFLVHEAGRQGQLPRTGQEPGRARAPLFQASPWAGCWGLRSGNGQRRPNHPCLPASPCPLKAISGHWANSAWWPGAWASGRTPSPGLPHHLPREEQLLRQETWEGGWSSQNSLTFFCAPDPYRDLEGGVGASRMTHLSRATQSHSPWGPAETRFRVQTQTPAQRGQGGEGGSRWPALSPSDERS